MHKKLGSNGGARANWGKAMTRNRASDRASTLHDTVRRLNRDGFPVITRVEPKRVWCGVNPYTRQGARVYIPVMNRDSIPLGSIVLLLDLSDDKQPVFVSVLSTEISYRSR